jgi:hypothetical protein
MKKEFIKFFIAVAQQKLIVKYSIIKLILYTLPNLKPGWKEFKREPERINLEYSEEKYPGLEVIEYLFIDFIECGYLTDEEMIQIRNVYNTIDLNNRKREFAYTEEELRYYLKSRLIKRMDSKINALGDGTTIAPDGATALFEVRDLVNLS